MQKLNELLQELGISKVRLAKYLGVSRQMVYNYLELDDLSKWTKAREEVSHSIDTKGLNSDSQKLLLDITSLIKERLLDDNYRHENYYTFTYLYHTLQLIDSMPEIRYLFGFMSKTGGYTDPEEYKFQEDKQFILEGIIHTALNLYNNGGSSRSKLQEAHRRWVAEIESKKEEKISRTQELSTVKIQALKELNYTKMDNSNANEVIEKILEILAKKS